MTELWSVAQAATHWGVTPSRARAILADRGIKRVSGYPADQVKAVVLRKGARTDLIAARLNDLLAHPQTHTPGADERYSLEDIRTRIDSAEPISGRHWSRILVEHSTLGEAVDALLARLESGEPIEPGWQPVQGLAEQAGLVVDGQPTEAGIERLRQRRRRDQLTESLIDGMLRDEDQPPADAGPEQREPR